ncbi:unnamed protein product, partial [Mesorhabditis spiculigera]
MLQTKAASDKTRNMQKELFKALVLQLTMPAIFVYTPMSIAFLGGLVGIQTFPIGTFNIILMLDPILEPIVIVWFVKCYRYPILRMLCCGNSRLANYVADSSNAKQSMEAPTAPSGLVTESARKVEA